MRFRPLRVALGAVVVVVATSGARVDPAPSGRDRLRSDDVAGVVALLHHDQQGIVLAHQAEAQSPAASTRARAAALAATFDEQARALVAVLDAHDVLPRARLVDTTRIRTSRAPTTRTGAADEKAVGCDLMPDDAVSRLAATEPGDFDEQFATLMDRHLVGGARLADAALDGSGLGSTSRAAVHWAAVRRAQRSLA